MDASTYKSNNNIWSIKAIATIVFFHKQPVKEGGFSGLEREREREKVL
jgi:hypothetical protein